MKYDNKFKLKCVKEYKNGNWVDTPEGVKCRNFRNMIIKWKKYFDLYGSASFDKKATNRSYTAEEKLDYVQQVLTGNTYQNVALKHHLEVSLLYQWVSKYKKLGYNGLTNQKRGRPSMKTSKKKNNIQKKLNESEYEELIRLRARVAYIEAENAIIKKEIALREELHAARLKAKKQRLLKNLENKDIH